MKISVLVRAIETVEDFVCKWLAVMRQQMTDEYSRTRDKFFEFAMLCYVMGARDGCFHSLDLPTWT
jgi:hypothetical protein